MDQSVLNLISMIAAVVSGIAAIGAIIVALYVNNDAKQPMVVVSIEHDRDHPCNNLVVSNYGNGVARNIRLKGFDYALVAPEFKDHANRSFIAKGIPILVPNASRSTTILAGLNKEEYWDKSAEIRLEYYSKGFFRKSVKRTESFVLDYQSFYGSLYTTSDLHEIKKDIDAIAKSIKSFDSKFDRLFSFQEQ